MMVSKSKYLFAFWFIYKLTISWSFLGNQHIDIPIFGGPTKTVQACHVLEQKMKLAKSDTTILLDCFNDGDK